jgi:hypothetical protein
LTWTSNVTAAATTVLGATGITIAWPTAKYFTDNKWSFATGLSYGAAVAANVLQCGINVGAGVGSLMISENSFDGFSYGIYASSTISGYLRGLNDNAFLNLATPGNIGMLNLTGQRMDKRRQLYTQRYEATLVFSRPAGTGEVFTTASGVFMGTLGGEEVKVILPYDAKGLVVSAVVNPNGSVSITIYNPTASTITTGAAPWVFLLGDMLVV